MLTDAAEGAFEFIDPSAQTVTSDVFGLWRTIPATPSGVAFDTMTAAAGGARYDFTPTWRTTLPNDIERAARQLDRADAQTHSAQQALRHARSRLDELAQTQRSSAVDFSTTPAAETPAPERELLDLIDELRVQEASVSFDTRASLSQRWRQVNTQFREAIERIIRSATHYAWVETRIDDQLLARTVMGWSGDTHTIWQTDASHEQTRLHRRSLGLALASRETHLRMFELVTQGAITLSLIAATPGGVVMALPAAWRFVNRIIAEWNTQR